ncbi:YrhK family protein [Bacillus solitudinis]|uniref:YrhK family protein n=1 Tax=Bacillus solitudinis TaxID=2014074 RepID=UPI001D0D67FA|nr:YrhK family protein [Bacillus solitudinis]
MPKITDEEEYLSIQAGRFRIFFNKRYRVITVLNDLLIGVLFLTGSCLNFFSITETYANVFYLLGSLFLVGRPVLRLMHNTSLRKEMKDKDTYTP